MNKRWKTRVVELTRILAAVVVLLLANAGVRGQAYLTQTLDTTSLNTATYTDLTGNAGPFPFNNLGVQATTNLGLLVSASTNGSTTFQFPTITPGQTFALGSSLNYAYTPSWTGGSIGSAAGLSADANFTYNLGPFSGTDSIFSTALNTQANGNIGGGTTLTGGTANGIASATPQFFGLTESAFLASASVGVNVGLNLQTAINYNPTVQYGYYSWVSTTGGVASPAVFQGVTSGALNYTFDSSLPGLAGANTFFLNIAPAVMVDLPITPTTTVSLPLSGDFNVSAFGDTLVDETVPLGTVSLYNANYDTWDDSMDFTGKYYSMELTASDGCGNNYAVVACSPHYTVDGDGLLVGTKVNIPGGGPSNLTGGGGNGGWDTNYTNAPLVPGVCDPSTGICYASNDPNMPVGPGSVTTTGGPVGTPEPGTRLLLVCGCVALMAFSGRKGLGVTAA
jgi:hypothetical protein